MDLRTCSSVIYAKLKLSNVKMIPKSSCTKGCKV